MKQTVLRGWNHSVCLIWFKVPNKKHVSYSNFGLRSRIRNMFLIRDLKPKLNKQSDSIRAKLLVSHILFTSFYTLFSHSPILIVCMQILASYFLSHCFRNCIYAELFYP